MTNEEHAIESRARYAALKEAGLCPGCKGTPKEGVVYCAACTVRIDTWQRANPDRQRGYWRLTRKERYHARKRANVCTMCGKARRGETTKCEPCRADYNARYRRGAKTTKTYACGLCRGKGHDKRTCPKWAKREGALRIEDYATARNSE